MLAIDSPGARSDNAFVGRIRRQSGGKIHTAFERDGACVCRNTARVCDKALAMFSVRCGCDLRAVEPARTARLQRRVEQFRPDLRVYDAAYAAKELDYAAERERQRKRVDIRVHLHPDQSHQDGGKGGGNQQRCADSRAVNAIAYLFSRALEFAVADGVACDDSAVQGLRDYVEINPTGFAELCPFIRLGRAARTKHLS